ncbi:hypothetical protein PFICI_13306 [Pestalotiopsis fici W106-1]|uniref:Uncharacterized protein n=1 Tax=Pestalotiopsis fici (strain W106-1 / CGMCC3.15140) TaxID=1229662 RepID=W3WNX4_PESFW|nr:uncharacterized protein PFICI_13306 [Pestalotiopsis fici W106-1]ETS74822.1 hypothetical protein PFICI_13306 [Pestalotiopsis fici W106-1]
MDYGYFNDQHALSLHRLDDWGVIETLKKMPEGYNPFDKHYEETELEGNRFQLVEGAELVKQIPPQFGVLCHPNTKNGKYYCRWDKGYDYDMARSEDNGAYEAAKYNQRLNPRIDRVGNYSSAAVDIPRTEDDMKAGSLALFPHVGGLVTSGMYRASGVPFAQQEAKQESRFFQSIWNKADIRELIMEKLFGHAEVLSNLTRTCQVIRRDVDNMMGFFDTNGMNFNLCDKFPEELDSMIQSGKITQEDVDNIRVPKFLVIGPCRKPTIMASGYHGDPNVFWPPQVQADNDEEPQSYETLFNERGFPIVNAYGHKQKKMTYHKQCRAVQRTLITLHQHRKNINYLALVQMDFLGVQTVEAIINSLDNLKCLCIYSCPLMDLSTVRSVIEAVGRTNEKRRSNGRPKLDLDIAPQYRQGPVGERMGSYGITHSDPRIFQNWGTDVGHALGASLVSLFRAAKKADIELLQPGKAFRRWLDRLPLAVNQTYNLCVAAAKYVSNEETRKIYALQVYPEKLYGGSHEKLTKQFDDTVAIDLMIAATAKPVTWSDFTNEGIFKCTQCNETLPGILFRYEAKQNRPEFIICEGCDLQNQLGYEIGHNHILKNQIARTLWRGVPEGCTNLDWLMGDSNKAVRNHKNFIKTTEQLMTPEVCMQEAEDLAKDREEVIQQMTTIFDFREKKHLNQRLKDLDNMIESHKVRAGQQRKPRTGNESMYDWDYRRQAYHWRGTVERGEFIFGAPYENITMLNLEKSFNMRH